MIDRLSEYGIDGPIARAVGQDPDVWPSRALIVDRAAADDLVRQVELLVSTQKNHAGTALVLNGRDEGAFTLTIDKHRHLVIEAVSLELTACGLASDEAVGCAALLAHAEEAVDVVAPDMSGEEDWKQLATTGTLRDEFRVDRTTRTIEASTSLLNGADDDYTQVGATTTSDLNELAPKVTQRIQEQIVAADPSLDEDLAAWASSDTPRPRVRLLGPVEAWGAGTPPKEKKAIHLEMFAYLATRENGATADQAAEAPSRPKTVVAELVSGVRAWCGQDPATGAKYVAEATRSKAAQAWGVGIYEMSDVITDLDLMRRLRVRAAGRGPDRIEDLWTALRLVAGRPFDQLRPKGWGWLLEGERLDEVAQVAIVDIAHTIALHELRHGALEEAGIAVRLALSACPDSEITRLDLSAVLEAQGRLDEAREVIHELTDHGDDDGIPDDLPDRTERLLRSRRVG